MRCSPTAFACPMARLTDRAQIGIGLRSVSRMTVFNYLRISLHGRNTHLCLQISGKRCEGPVGRLAATMLLHDGRLEEIAPTQRVCCKNGRVRVVEGQQ
jgi:hypothetical protein